MHSIKIVIAFLFTLGLLTGRFNGVLLELQQSFKQLQPYLIEGTAAILVVLIALFIVELTSELRR